MLRVLLVGIGSRFNHVNLAVRILSGYVTSHLSAAENRNCEIQCGEWTTAVPLQELIRGITGSQPDIVLFSVYIWNQSLVFQVIRELPKIMPGIITGAGGPEVSYRAKEILDSVPELDFIISGEGEIPLLHLCRMAAGLQCRDSDGVAGAAGLRSGLRVRQGCGPAMLPVRTSAAVPVRKYRQVFPWLPAKLRVR